MKVVTGMVRCDTIQVSPSCVHPSPVRKKDTEFLTDIRTQNDIYRMSCGHWNAILNCISFVDFR